MSGQSFQALRDRVGDYRDKVAKFHEQSQTSTRQMGEARGGISDAPHALEVEAAEQFRTGQAGPVLQQIQLAVDAGGVTWTALVIGKGDAATQGLFDANALAIWQACEHLANGYDPGERA